MENSVAHINDKYLFSLTQLSTALGPARETIIKKITSCGVKSSGERRGHAVYHVGEVAEAVFTPDIFGDAFDPELLPRKDRLDHYKGNREKRQDAEENNVVCSVESVKKEWSFILENVGRVLDVITDKLERKCGLTAEQLNLVETTIDNIRNDLADKLEK